jgi:hypothetical protein
LRYCQAFCYNAQLFYDFVDHSWDTISDFGTVLIHFAKFLGRSQDSVILSNDYCRLTGAEGGSRFGREALGERAARSRWAGAWGRSGRSTGAG